MKIVKWSLLVIVLITLVLFIGTYAILWSSLPTLDDDVNVGNHILQEVSIERDDIGTATINASSIEDAAFALGFAHAQDRLFQMDLLRRNAAGELSAILGKRALQQDKQHRIHQFRQRAVNILNTLPDDQQLLLQAYTNGVNKAAEQYSVLPFEYLITSSEFAPWRKEDSLLVTFSMYLDLQIGQVNRDFHFTGVEKVLGSHILDFFTQPSTFQSTMDYSIVPIDNPEIPEPPKFDDFVSIFVQENERDDIGSNNWAVNGEHTYNRAGGLLSNDMHLGLNVPIIWYKAQLNYPVEDKDVSVTGVTLPGTPGVVVGATKHLAWGFTNSNVDNVDWVEIDNRKDIEQVTETIEIADDENYQYNFETSKYGPIKYIQQTPFALSWVAHQDYAVNMSIIGLAEKESVQEALAFAKEIRIPTQNMVVADKFGNVAWQLTGAISGRTTPSKTAITTQKWDDAWFAPEPSPANMLNPEHGRIWTANARVVSSDDLKRYGDGGYALGARQRQIGDSLLRPQTFDEQSFYELQLDNRALFLMPWHNLLVSKLEQNPQVFAQDLKYLQNWRACACADSVGYTLVRWFRSSVINELMGSINAELDKQKVNSRYLLRTAETPIWQLLNAQPLNWLSKEHSNYDEMLKTVYVETREKLFTRFSDGETNFDNLRWGNVNALAVKHPFGNSLGPLNSLLNMPVVEAFGDSYMPNVQSTGFGASQRLIVQPSHLENGILTIPGGQSMHPLSKFYENGFHQYVNAENTPLLPKETTHKMVLRP